MKVAKKQRGLFTPVNIEDVYRQLGQYTIKIIIDPRESAEVEIHEIVMNNSDGPVRLSYKRWGTKLTMTFTVDESFPDGAASILIDMSSRGRRSIEMLRIWVVKP